MLTALLGGQISMGYCTLMVCQAYIKNGKLRALAVTAARRSGHAPRSAHGRRIRRPRLRVAGGRGLFAPAGTPKNIVDRLYRQSESIIRSRDMTGLTEANGSEVVAGSPQEFMAVIKRDYDRYGKVVKKLRIRADE